MDWIRVRVFSVPMTVMEGRPCTRLVMWCVIQRGTLSSLLERSNAVILPIFEDTSFGSSLSDSTALSSHIPVRVRHTVASSNMIHMRMNISEARPSKYVRDPHLSTRGYVGNYTLRHEHGDVVNIRVMKEGDVRWASLEVPLGLERELLDDCIACMCFQGSTIALGTVAGRLLLYRLGDHAIHRPFVVALNGGPVTHVDIRGGGEWVIACAGMRSYASLRWNSHRRVYEMVHVACDDSVTSLCFERDSAGSSSRGRLGSTRHVAYIGTGTCAVVQHRTLFVGAQPQQLTVYRSLPKPAAGAADADGSAAATVETRRSVRGTPVTAAAAVGVGVGVGVIAASGDIVAWSDGLRVRAMDTALLTSLLAMSPSKGLESLPVHVQRAVAVPVLAWVCCRTLAVGWGDVVSIIAFPSAGREGVVARRFSVDFLVTGLMPLWGSALGKNVVAVAGVVPACPSEDDDDGDNNNDDDGDGDDAAGASVGAGAGTFVMSCRQLSSELVLVDVDAHAAISERVSAHTLPSPSSLSAPPPSAAAAAVAKVQVVWCGELPSSPVASITSTSTSTSSTSTSSDRSNSRSSRCSEWGGWWRVAPLLAGGSAGRALNSSGDGDDGGDGGDGGDGDAAPVLLVSTHQGLMYARPETVQDRVWDLVTNTGTGTGTGTFADGVLLCVDNRRRCEQSRPVALAKAHLCSLLADIAGAGAGAGATSTPAITATATGSASEFLASFLHGCDDDPGYWLYFTDLLWGHGYLHGHDRGSAAAGADAGEGVGGHGGHCEIQTQSQRDSDREGGRVVLRALARECPVGMHARVYTILLTVLVAPPLPLRLPPPPLAPALAPAAPSGAAADADADVEMAVALLWKWSRGGTGSDGSTLDGEAAAVVLEKAMARVMQERDDDTGDKGCVGERGAHTHTHSHTHTHRRVLLLLEGLVCTRAVQGNIATAVAALAGAAVVWTAGAGAGAGDGDGAVGAGAGAGDGAGAVGDGAATATAAATTGYGYGSQTWGLLVAPALVLAAVHRAGDGELGLLTDSGNHSLGSKIRKRETTTTILCPHTHTHARAHTH